MKKSTDFISSFHLVQHVVPTKRMSVSKDVRETARYRSRAFSNGGAAILSDPDTREMAAEDFEKAQLGAAMRVEGKTRITMWVDRRTVEAFKARAAQEGKGYQTLINDALRSAAAAVLTLLVNNAPDTTDFITRHVARLVVFGIGI